MPTHHTKFTIAKPQPTGTLIPQMPTPFANSQATDTNSSIASENEIISPTIQPRFNPRASTIDAILSVTLAKLWPRGRSGSSCVFVVSMLDRSAHCDIRRSCLLNRRDADFARRPGTSFAVAC